MNEERRKRVVIIGGGLVGALDAIYFAREGFQVDVFDVRPDPRKEEFVAGRSINLALSVRGREALRGVGAEDSVVETGIPMYARMIHGLNGELNAQPYGKKHQHILSIDRRKLNESLIDISDSEDNITYHFSHKCLSVDLDGKKACFENCSDPGRIENYEADLIVGCDGAYSKVRQHLIKKVRMNYRQEFIPHGYKEIQMKPDGNGDFKMDPDYLHIWPRNTFMMIALPNQDKTFTCTTFLPFEDFDKLDTEDRILDFFEKYFPDSIPLIGRKQLVSDFLNNPTGSMISIKCNPYHYKDKCVIMGDAAHAMVPFYGQGMNCGFEDCLVFHELLTKNGMDIETTLPEYSRIRNPDAEAMNDLAMYNYIEMRKHVNSRFFLFKKRIDSILNWIMPNTWIPLYTMVTFSRIPYRTVIDKSRSQDKVLGWSFVVMAGLIGGSLVYMAGKGFTRTPPPLETSASWFYVPFDVKSLASLIWKT